jgi:hypothetical protein
MKEEDIVNALKYAKEIPSIENRLQQTKIELKGIENNKNISKAELFYTNRFCYYLRFLTWQRSLF